MNVTLRRQLDGRFRYNAATDRDTFVKGELESLAVEGLVANLVSLGLDKPPARRRGVHEVVQIGVTTSDGDALSQEWPATSPAALAAVKLIRQLKPLDLALSEGIYRLGPGRNLGAHAQPSAWAWAQEALPDGKIWPGVMADLKEELKSGGYSDLLVKHPDLIHCVDAEGQQPLHMAARWGSRQMVEQLLASGAAIEARDSEGFTPFLRACQEGREDASVMLCLMERGADLRATLPDGRGALHLAAAYSSPWQPDAEEPAEARVVPLMLAGLSGLTRDRQGHTPHGVALDRKRTQLAKVMEGGGGVRSILVAKASPHKRPPLVICAERQQIRKFNARVVACANAEEFAELEKLAAQLLKQKARFPDGRPQLETLYEQATGDLEGGANESEWSAALHRHNRWVVAYPKSASARIVRAKFYISYAWNARGGGYANTVKEQGWKLFHKRLELAEQDLRLAQKLDPGDPYGYATCITLAMANGWNRAQMEDLLNRSMTAFPRCTTALENAAYYLTPRWQGESGDLEKFARQWSQKDPAYYSVVWDAIQMLGGIQEEVEISWPQLKASYEVRLKASPSQIVKNRYARAAVTFEDKETALRLAREIGAQWDPNSWHDDEDLYNALRVP
ncbi:DUF4034 domain-containing protein [bacterium]|nr:DUF4034 domain-containing protein [bacterium]